MLGHGGMGVVYETKDEELGTTVALKTIRKRTPDALARMKMEFRALQDVHHPNVVTLGELVTEGEECFFTMEFVDGTDFIAYVRAPESPSQVITSGSSHDSLAVRLDATTLARPLSQPPPPDSVLHYDETRLRHALVQLAEGLCALHAAGLVHRDIKPGNVLVTREGRLVILDFGLVADTRGTAETTGDDLVGTPAYMAPEQAATTALGPAADWYAVGAMLFEALTGRVPYLGAPLDVLLRKQTEQPPPPSALSAAVPSDLDALCVALMRFDPEERLGGARLLRELGVKTPGGAPSQTQQAPFVGRASELEVLDDAFRATRNGAVALLVKGESGMGKSCLVRRFIDTLAVSDQGLLVLSGRCYEREAVAYKAVDGVIDALARFLTRLPAEEVGTWLPMKIEPLVQVFPVLRRVETIAERMKGGKLEASQMDQAELRGRAFTALREMLTRIATRRPLIVSIDDLQWADRDSLALLSDVLRAPDSPPLLLLATMRTGAGVDPSERFRDGLVRMGIELREIDLVRLSEDHARELASVLLARAAPQSKVEAKTIAEEAEGHPFFIDALVRHAMIEDEARGTLRLEDALWSRVQRLEPTARELVQLLAIAGTPLSQGVLARAAGGASAFAENVAYLRVAHLVTITGGRGSDTIDTYHDKVRAAVNGHLDDAAKTVGHRRIALALETAEVLDPEALFTHWRGAGDDARAATYAEQAADGALRTLAFDHAATLYEAAIELGPDDPQARSVLREKLGDAHAGAGRGPLAAHAYDAAANGVDRARSIELRSRAAQQLLRSGHFDEGLDTVAIVLAEFGLGLPRSSVAALTTLLFWRALLLFRGLGFRRRDASLVPSAELRRVDMCTSIARHIAFVDVTLGAAFHQRYLFSALRCGEPTRVLLALGSEVVYLSSLGTRAWRRRTSPLIARISELAESVGDKRTAMVTSMSIAVAHYFGAGDFKVTLGLCDDAVAGLHEHSGVAWELALVHLYGLFSLVYVGEWDELGVRTEAILRDAKARGDLFAVTYCSTGMLACAWLAKDDPAQARRHIAEALQAWSKRGFHIAHYFEGLGLTLADLYEGHVDDAHERFEKLWPRLRRSFFLTVQVVRIEAKELRARAMLAVARSKPEAERARLVKHARRIARELRTEDSTWASSIACMLEASAAHVEGDTRATSHHLEEAARAFDTAHMALHATVARWCRASLDGPAPVPQAPVKNFARVVAMFAPTFASKA